MESMLVDILTKSIRWAAMMKLNVSSPLWKYGIASGQRNFLVARSEHTTVSGVILTYQNNLDVPTPAARSTSPRSVKSSSNLS